MLHGFALQSKSRHFTLPGEAKQWKNFGIHIVTFETEGQILKMTLPQQNGHRIKRLHQN